MIIIKKINYLIILIFFSLISTGCISYTELNELGIISAIGIDIEADKFLLSTNFIIPKKEQGESSYTTKTITSTGKSIDEALNNIYLSSNKKIYLSHLNFVAISEAVAKEHLEETYTFFLENAEARNAFPIILIKDSTPLKLLEITDKPDNITNLLETNEEKHGTTMFISMEDFVKRLLNGNAVLPSITVKSIPEVTDLAIMKNNKLQDYLSETSSNAYLFLTNKIKEMNLTIKNKDKNIELKVEENETIISNKKNKIFIEIKSKISSSLDQDNKKISLLYEEEIKKRIINLLDKTKADNLDILQFSNYIKKNDYPYYKKNKSNLFKNLIYEISFKIEVLEDKAKTKRKPDYE
ncbi:MAG: Ger(x)C family spore germination protein [Bacilli bacterium]